MTDHDCFGIRDDEEMGKETGGIQRPQMCVVVIDCEASAAAAFDAAAGVAAGGLAVVGAAAAAAEVREIETCSVLVDCKPCRLHRNDGYNDWSPAVRRHSSLRLDSSSMLPTCG